MVKVTVLMTLYNKAPYVMEAARSVLNGTFHDLELLVVDDASTDGGPELISSLPDPRVRLVRQARNGGRAAAADRGYREARGEYIAVLDADDVQHPERLARQVAYMDAHPEVAISGTGVRYFGGRTGTQAWPLNDEVSRAHLLFTDPVLYGTCIMRRSVIVKHGLSAHAGWSLPGEDYLFTMKWAPYGEYGNLPDILVDYRIGEQNQRHGRDPVSDRAGICREAFKVLGMAISEDELDVHLILHQLNRVDPDPRVVSRLVDWEQELLRRVGQRKDFPMDAFRRELTRRMDKAFYTIADRDLRGAIHYLDLRRSMNLERLKYAFVAAGRRLLQRVCR